MAGIFEDEIDALCERFQALKTPTKRGFVESFDYNGLLKQTTVDDNCPETLERMRALLIDAANAINPFFARFAKEAVVGKPDEYVQVATDAIEHYMQWELQDKADKIREDQPYVDPNEEHRLGARQLGVGTYV
jgi:hypothetical protein